MARGSDAVDYARCLLSRQNLTDDAFARDLSTLEIGSDTIDSVLCQSHKLEFKYFCKVHMEELCTTCRRLKHKDCTPLLDIKQAMIDIYSEDHGERIIQSMRDLCEQYDNCKTVAEAIKNNLQAKRQVYLDNVKRTRKVIDDFLNKLVSGAVAEINRNFAETETTVEEQINVCGGSVSALKLTLADVEKTKSQGNQMERFMKINTATQQTKQYYNVLKDLCSEMLDIDANIKPTPALSGALDNLKNVFNATSKVIKRYRHTAVTPLYTGIPEKRENVQPMRYHGQSVPQVQANLDLAARPKPVRVSGTGTQTGQRNTAQQGGHTPSNQGPLTTQMLAGVSIREQKQMLGERLYPLIKRIDEAEAGKVTGMLLELPNEELLDLLRSKNRLESKVNEAVTVLAAFHAKEASKKQTKVPRSKTKR